MYHLMMTGLREEDRLLRSAEDFVTSQYVVVHLI